MLGEFRLVCSLECLGDSLRSVSGGVHSGNIQDLGPHGTRQFRVDISTVIGSRVLGHLVGVTGAWDAGSVANVINSFHYDVVPGGECGVSVACEGVVCVVKVRGAAAAEGCCAWVGGAEGVGEECGSEVGGEGSENACGSVGQEGKGVVVDDVILILFEVVGCEDGVRWAINLDLGSGQVLAMPFPGVGEAGDSILRALRPCEAGEGALVGDASRRAVIISVGRARHRDQCLP
mmetsp:Transcript_38980/g.76198  ORF Transcript_38980/g.76198 Transcript_38980/m.76198 type:complete len:233 (-) Transcript_38980:41-739(-)